MKLSQGRGQGHRYFWLGWFAIALAVVPAAALGADAYHVIHDNLDGHVPNALALARSNVFFSIGADARVDGLMGGLSRTLLPSPLDVWALLMFVLPPVAALIASAAIVHATAYVGMYGLLRHHLPGQLSDLEAAGAASLYGVLPVFPNLGLSVHGVALLALVLLNVYRQRSRWWDWAGIAAFPLFSQLPISGVFAIGLLAVLCAVSAVRRDGAARRLSVALALLTGGYLLVNAPLLVASFGPSAVPQHRVEFDWYANRETLRETGRRFSVYALHGRFNAASFPEGIWCAALLALALGWRERLERKLLIAGLGTLLAFAGVYAAWYSVHAEVLRRIAALAGGLKLHRVAWLSPLVWYMVFGLALRVLSRRRYGTVLVVVALALQSYTVLRQHELLRANVASLTDVPRLRASRRYRALYTFREFFSPQVFERAAALIGRDQRAYRVLTIGMHPGMATFNGFQTLGGYATSYPLEYKHRFRRVIATELARDTGLSQRFDGWGSRCYAVSSELAAAGRRLPIRKAADLTLRDLRFDTAAIHDLGGEYILSTVAIANHAALQWRPLGRVEDRAAPFDLYVYALDPR